MLFRLNDTYARTPNNLSIWADVQRYLAPAIEILAGPSLRILAGRPKPSKSCQAPAIESWQAGSAVESWHARAAQRAAVFNQSLNDSWLAGNTAKAFKAIRNPLVGPVRALEAKDGTIGAEEKREGFEELELPTRRPQ